MNGNQMHFHEILADFDDAMLITVGGDGSPRARPMRVAKLNDGADLWFVTNRHSGKVEELQTDDSVAITMQGGGKYLSLTGKAELVDERSTIDELWNDAWKIWFPDGKNDPAIILVKVIAEEGTYWDISGTNRLRYLYEAGKAYFTGQAVDASSLDMEGSVKL